MENDPKRGSGKALEALSSLLSQYPKTKNVRGKLYKAAVFQIMSKDAFGRPKDTKMIHEDDTVHLDGGEEFMVGFVLDVFTDPRSSAKA